MEKVEIEICFGLHGDTNSKLAGLESVASLKSTNGYLKVGGIMIQWGKYSAPANTNTTVYYATAFAAVYSVVMVPEDSNTSQNKSLAVCNIGTSSFQINNTERVGFPCRWIAVGTY